MTDLVRRFVDRWRGARLAPEPLAPETPASESKASETPTTMRETFTRIVEDNAWGDPESLSGPGSTVARTAAFLDSLVDLLARFEIESLLDAPCGDGNWIGPVVNAVEQYVGLDIVPELVAMSSKRHAGPGRRFVCADLTTDPLPRVDLVLCRDGLVHLAFADIARALDNVRRSGARFLLTTTFVDHAANDDIVTGAWRPLNLELTPFEFPPPLASIDERCTHTEGRYRDKRLALWELDALPVA
ncbi:MAG: class I SAM-dependent methyltransferase, partial [Acidobacteriota bacterium]